MSTSAAFITAMLHLVVPAIAAAAFSWPVHLNESRSAAQATPCRVTRGTTAPEQYLRAARTRSDVRVRVMADHESGPAHRSRRANAMISSALWLDPLSPSSSRGSMPANSPNHSKRRDRMSLSSCGKPFQPDGASVGCRRARSIRLSNDDSVDSPVGPKTAAAPRSELTVRAIGDTGLLLPRPVARR